MIKLKYNTKENRDVIKIEERENLLRDYEYAFIASNKVSKEKVKDILNMLISEKIIDNILMENANPKIKLYENAEEFAKAITSYEYKYVNQTQNKIQIESKKILIKQKGETVKLGTISNDPSLPLEKVNDLSDFVLDKPTFVWMMKNLKGKEELAIYTANRTYESKTYRKWLEEQEDFELKEEAEKIAISFSNKLGYVIDKDYVFEIIKKLNRALVIPFVPSHNYDSDDRIIPLSYNFVATSEGIEFESYLYNTLEKHLGRRFNYKQIESLSSTHIMIGKKVDDINENGQSNQIKELANFNLRIMGAVVKKETLVSDECFELLKKVILQRKSPDSIDWSTLPVPSVEVIFYFPKVQQISDSTNFEKENTSFYHQEESVLKKKMIKVQLVYLSEIGTKLKNAEEIYAWIGEKVEPEIPKTIIDENGFGWIYKGDRRDESNNITFVYEKWKKKVKIDFVAEQGKQIKESQEFVYQVGEMIQYEQDNIIIDNDGKKWRAKTLDKIRQRVSSEEENRISVIYEKCKFVIRVSFINENGQKLMPDKEEEIQEGTKYNISQEKEWIDENNCYWIGEVVSEDNVNVVFKCRPLMTKVITQYLNNDGDEIFASVQSYMQVGSKYLPNIINSCQGYDGKYWQVAEDQKTEFEIKKEENKIIIGYEPSTVNVTLQYYDEIGKEIKNKKIISAQIGSVWMQSPEEKIKDEKGNEWQAIIKSYEPIKISENEQENIITYQYKMQNADVIILYQDISGNALKAEEHFKTQVGSAFIPTPEFIIEDYESKKWQLLTLKPPMLKVKSIDNKVIATYKELKNTVVCIYEDLNGNELKMREEYLLQVGSKYEPIGKQIEGENEVWKISKIEPSELIVSENKKENEVHIIYEKVQQF